MRNIKVLKILANEDIFAQVNEARYSIMQLILVNSVLEGILEYSVQIK